MKQISKTMVKRKSIYKVSPCRSEEIQSSLYECDECGKEVERYVLRVNIFGQYDDEPKEKHLCSWDCVFRCVGEIDTDGFVELPSVNYDMVGSTGIDGFREFVKKCGLVKSKTKL